MKNKLLIPVIALPLAFASCGKKEVAEENKPAAETAEKTEPAPTLVEEPVEETSPTDGLEDEAPNVEEPVEGQ